MNSAAVVLLSGGLDSTALLHDVSRRREHSPVLALSFLYGQKHVRELDCAWWQAAAAGATHHVVDLAFFGALTAGASALVTGGEAVPDLADLPFSERDQPPTYVPHRNIMLLSIAAAFAESHGARHLYYGAQAQDEYGYWDCTREFLDRLNATLALNRRGAVTVHAPFMSMRKSEILRLCLEHGVDFSHTWSCYKGGERACGTCPTCVERLTAFLEAGFSDPAPYETNRPPLA